MPQTSAKDLKDYQEYAVQRIRRADLDDQDFLLCGSFVYGHRTTSE